MINPDHLPEHYYDMDHVRVDDGRIYRVLGNFALDDGGFLAYNLYSPDPAGDRTFRGVNYVKNYTEDNTSPRDVLDTYDILAPGDVAEYFDPISAAKEMIATYDGTVWAKLYRKLTDIFGTESIGIFGSALPGSGLHQNPDGSIKNDVDFFIEGLENIPKLERQLPAVREDLGFSDYDTASQQGIIRAWSKVFRNPNNTLDEIMARRWSGMQLDDAGRIVLNTFRFRDRNVVVPPQLLAAKNIIRRNVEVEGVAIDTQQGNLYPRAFAVESAGSQYPVYSFWWKFSSPVREMDQVAVCGDVIDVNGKEVLRLTNYEDHWIHL
jgi:predicted nucleotidyltransferase